jgi:TP901 family phage tail tape measure protein
LGNRENKVVLTAQVAGYISAWEQVGSTTKKSTEEMAKAEAQLQKQHAAMTTLGIGMTAFGAVAAAAVGIAVSKYMEFDKQMSAVQAATHESADNMALLRDAAIEAGATTAYSATEAAAAITELSKAGVTTRDILGGGLAGALSLAAAGELEVAQAAEIAATAMTQFNLKGSDVPHIADLLAAGAGKAQGSVDDLSQALNQGGLVASQAGFSIEETTGTLSAFAAAGLLGSDAGTSLKTAILALQNPSAKAKEVMDQYGLSVYDSQGNMLGFGEIAGQLQGKLGGLTDEQRNAALATIFGNDAVRAANVLYANGQDGINGWTRKVNDAGYAAETAAILQDNLAGDLEKLGGAFDTLLIKTGAAADGPLRYIVQGVTDLVDAFSDLPPVAQSGALAMGTVVAGAALLAGGVLVAIPKLYELKVALDVLSASSMPGVASGATVMTSAVTKSGTALAATARFLTGPWGVALAAASVGVKLLTDYLDSLKATSAEYQNTIATGKSAADLFEVADQGRLISYLDQATGSAKSFQQALNTIDTNAFLTGLSLPTQQLQQSLKDLGDELGTTADTDLPSAQNAFSALAAETDGSREQLLQLLDAMPGYRDALVEQATAAGKASDDATLLELAQGSAADTASTAAEAYIEQVDAVDQVADAVADLIKQFDELNGLNSDAVQSNADFQASLAGISDDVQKQKDAFIELQKDGYEAAHGSLDGFVGSLDGFSLSLDENTASGSANAASLTGVADSARKASEDQFKLDVSTMGAKAAADKYAGTLADQRAKFEASARAAGYNADQVKALADRVFQMPSSKQLTILAETAAAQAKIDNIITLNSGRVVRISVQATNDSPAGSWTGGLTKKDGGVVEYYGDGGMSENHVAEIAPAGAWRVWAEPETGGEAYIPLAPNKRDRSIAIWEETGRRLQAFADGDVWNPTRMTSTMPGLSGAPAFDYAALASAMNVGPRVVAPITVQSAPGLDTEAVGTIAGREIGRYLAGSPG